MRNSGDQLRELIRLARQGDVRALGELLEVHRPYLKILAERMLTDRVNARMDTSDVVQQTCLSVHRCLHQFTGDDEAQFVAWLRAVHENKIRDAVREHLATGKRSVEKEAKQPGSGAYPEPADSQVVSPSRILMREERAVQLARLLEQLPDDQRQAVRLRHLEGFSLVEIAERLSRSEVAVAGLVKRGLIKLRSLMKEET